MAIEDVRREAANQVTRAEEAVLEATARAEAAAADVKEMFKQVNAMVKQVMEANARAEAAKSTAADATKCADTEEEARRTNERFKPSAREEGKC